MIKKIFGSVLLLFLLVSIAIIVLVSTETGLTLLWQQANKYLPNEMNIVTVEGRLAGPLFVNGFNYENETVRINFDQAQLDWQPSALFSRSIHIELGEIKNLRIEQLSKGLSKTDTDEPVTIPDKIELPVSIILERFHLDQFAFKGLTASEPFCLNSAEFAGTFDSDKFSITKLEIDGPEINVVGDLQTIPHSGYTSSGELHWKFIFQELPTLNGLTTFEGDIQQLAIQQDLQQPYNLNANVLLNDLIDSFRFSANIRVSQINLQEIKKDFPEAILTSEIDAIGTLEKVNLQAKLHSNKTEYGTLNAKLTGDFTKQVIDISKLELNIKEKPTQLVAQGKITLSEKNPNVHITADWRNFDWPLLEEPQLLSSQGKLSLTGTLDDYQLRSNIALSVPERLRADLALAGSGDKDSLALTQIGIDMLDGNINGSSLIQWQPSLETEVDLVAKNINPKQLMNDWPGKLNFELKAHANKNKENLSVAFEHFLVDGILRDYQLQLTAKGDYTDEILNLEKFELTSGESLLTANGVIGETIDVNWKIDSDNIASLLPDASGKINSKGVATGPIKQPLLKGQLSGQELAFQDHKVKSVDLDMDVDLANNQSSTLVLNLDDIKISDTLIKTTQVELNGKLDDHTLDFSLDSNQGQVQLALLGRLSGFSSAEPNWKFQLKKGTVAYPKLAPWILQSPANGSVSKSLVELNDTCWASHQTRFCFDSMVEGANVKANFTLQSLPFNYFKEFLPPDLVLIGKLNGKGSFVSNNSSTPTIDVQLDTTVTEVSLADDSGEQTTVFGFKPGNIRVLQNESGLQANLALPLQQNGGINFYANVAAGKQPLNERPLMGDLKIQFNDLSDYEQLIPQAEQLKGKINGEIALAGSIQRPELHGQLELQDAATDLPDFGLAIRDMNLALSGTEANNLSLKGSVNSGGGNLKVDGTLGFTDQGATTKLALNGEKFEIYNTLDAHIYASPNLELAIDGKKVNISGEVTIPQADITPNKNTGSGAVTVSEDQVIVVPTSEEQETPYLITTQVKVNLGPDVHISAYGLNTDLHGSLAISDKPKRGTRGKGELNLVNGNFKAYGQELDIETGKIIFTGGPIEQPGIDLRASRMPRENILVGVEVRGNISKPDVNLFSEPSMSRSEQLSYLTLGKPLQEASAGESSGINQAALGIGFSKGSKITDELGKQLGFDEAGFESGQGGNGDQSAFVLGKYLSPKLYISYGIGVFEPVNIFRVQYFLGKHWKLVTESSGGNSGGDIYYEIERGK